MCTDASSFNIIKRILLRVHSCYDEQQLIILVVQSYTLIAIQLLHIVNCIIEIMFNFYRSLANERRSNTLIGNFIAV